MPGNTWNGFVASVSINMIPGQPVELIIKANLPLGYTLLGLDTAFNVSSLGTDQWLNTTNALANTHNSISAFGPRTIDQVPLAYFTETQEIKNNSGITVMPNPTNGLFSITMQNTAANAVIEIYNSLGEKIYYKTTGKQPIITINLTDKPKGIYFIRLTQDNKTILTEKLMFTN